jgi:hypothetical protein
MKRSFLIQTLALLPLLLSCGKAPLDLGPQIRTETQMGVSTEALKGLRVQELFVVLFPKDFQPGEWRAIFDDTRVMSRNKKRLRELEGATDGPSQDERAELIGKNAEILMKLGEKSLFLMSWSAADENCRIKDTLKIVCKPSNPDNPMNGGLPKNILPITVVQPDPVRSDVKTPYLALRLEQADPARGSRYGLDLRLKVERLDGREKWFKGEALPLAGSEFINREGVVVKDPFPYGYAELTIAE